MKLYKGTQSAVKPQKIDIKEKKVFVSKNIEEIEHEEGKIFVFDLYSYDKDEYIAMIQKESETLNEQLLETQMALCEIYELLKEEASHAEDLSDESILKKELNNSENTLNAESLWTEDDLNG